MKTVVPQPDTASVRRRVVVHGRVQGVWFRETTRRLAERHGVAGWIRNDPDGTVTGVFEGDEDDVERLVDFCRLGPPDAHVERVEVTEEEPESVRGFDIR
jgi:acylphosphatase